MIEKAALVTGGAGFIGSHIVDYLLEKNWRVRVIDNLSTGDLSNLRHHKKNQNLTVIVGDLRRLGVACSCVKGVETVFHFAANPEVRLSTTAPKKHFEQNIMATFNLLEAIRRGCSVKDMVFASSSSVYGEATADAHTVKEDHHLDPVSVYGSTKVSCEYLISTFARLYGFKSVALRYANVVGPRLTHGVVCDFITKLQQCQDSLEILGDGHQTRSYVYIDDAISATDAALVAAEKHFEAYNVGNDDYVTVNQVADIVARAVGLKNVKHSYKPLLHGVGWLGDVKRIALDITKIKKLGWKPSLGSSQALALASESLCRTATNRSCGE